MWTTAWTRRNPGVAWCAAIPLLTTACDAADRAGGPSPTGVLSVANTTVGGAFDPDGYEVTIDGGEVALLEVNDALRPMELPVGAHSLRVGGLASNCSLDGEADRSVFVPDGAVVDLMFRVSCVPPPELSAVRILFASREAGATSLVWMDADGGHPSKAVAPWATELRQMSVSRDRRRIVYESDPGPWFGDPETRVFDLVEGRDTLIHAGPAYAPRWSPDGKRIAYTAEPMGWWGGTLYVMDADGGHRTRLLPGDPGDVTEDHGPRWSPDGNRIAFTRDDDPLAGGDYFGVWVVNLDGTGLSRVTREMGGARPVWSPAGDQIAFVSYADLMADGIAVTDIEGTGSTRVLDSKANVRPWEWSSDGTWVLLTKQTGPGRSDVFLLEPGSGALVRVTADGAWKTSPSFW